MTNAVDAVGTSEIALVTTISVTALHSLVNCETAPQVVAVAAGPVAALVARVMAAAVVLAAVAAAVSAAAAAAVHPGPQRCPRR